MTKIPVTRNLNTKFEDIVGTLDLTPEMAGHMAECYLRGFEFTVNACLEISNEAPVLKSVSLEVMPCQRSEEIADAAKRCQEITVDDLAFEFNARTSG